MEIIILSGGSGTRLWPLSNDARSKQFLRLLPTDGSEERESMIQRVVRQLRQAVPGVNITVATGSSQRDAILSQIGDGVDIVTEPVRRHTFPAIALACEFLALKKGCSPDEPVVVIPCDAFTGPGYFQTIRKMAEGVEQGDASMVLMGINPIFPSTKYGYILPEGERNALGMYAVSRFVEKPDVSHARELIEQGALWNGGVFAFRLGFMTQISRRYVAADSFEALRDSYESFPVTSFDYEVAEKAGSLAVIPFYGQWKDLGTWNTLTDELKHQTYGNVLTDGTQVNTHIINELDIPIMCIGTQNLVIAASPDGILVTEKSRSEDMKRFVPTLRTRPMYEERRWGTYKVIDRVTYPDGFSALTKQLSVNPGCSLSYQRHSCRDEVWTFIDGEGEIMLNDERRPVRRGDTIFIPKGQKHALRAITPLTFIEVQSGTNLIEEDIERFPLEW